GQLSCPIIPELSGRQNDAIAKAIAFDRNQRTGRVEDFLLELMSNEGASNVADKDEKPPYWMIGLLVAGVAAAVITSAVWRVPAALWGTVLPTPGSESHPSQASGGGGFTPEQKELLDRLGIDAAGGGGKDLRALILTAPRRVRLGSTTPQIQTAISLCQ